MKKVLSFEYILISICALVFLCSPVYAEIDISGDLEIDTSYTTTSTDPSTDTTEYDLGGRIKIAPVARKEVGKLFFEAKAEILAKTISDGDGVQVDDVYGKIGTSSFDVQIGRYEAWNLYDESNDMLIVGAPNGVDRYKAAAARGRIDSAGQLAIHAFAGDAFSFEGGIVYGKDGADNVFGLRPVILTKFDNFEFAAGVDYLNTAPQDDSATNETTTLGYGARIKAVLGIATLGINYASGTLEETGQPDETTNSLGGYCDLALGNGVLTLGGSMTIWEEDNIAFEKEHTQYYIAYAHPLPIDGAAIKFAVSQANATEETATGDVDSDALGFKVRLYYAF